MKKIKMTLVALAIIVGTAGAFASKSMRAVCEQEQQYFYSSAAGYQPAYYPYYYCIQGGSGIYCTYYISKVAPITYTVCTYGTYTVEY